MWRLLVFVKRAAGGGHRQEVELGWSYDRTEATTSDPMDSVRGMIQAIYAVVEVSFVGEWGSDSDGDDAAPVWADSLMSVAGVESACGSWVEVDGEPYAFVVAAHD